MVFVLPIIFACIIAKSVFLGRIVKYNILYNCSDIITNEIFKQEHDKNKQNILYTIINLAADVFFFLFNGILFLIIFLIIKYEKNILLNNVKKSHINSNSDIPQNDVSSDKIPKEAVKEVIVNNNVETQIEQTQIHRDNNNINHNSDLGLPTSNSQGNNSEKK